MQPGQAAISMVEVLPDGSGRRREWVTDLETARAVAEALGEPVARGWLARSEPIDLAAIAPAD